MFKKILAGTDGSDTARLAIAHAAHLADELSAELTVASVYAPEPDRTSGPPRAGEFTAPIARALLRDVENQYRERISLTTRAVEGNPATALLEVVENEGFDLLVVGNRGMSKTPWTLQRSVPGRVSQRAPVAVLIADTVRGRAPGYAKILVGVDGSSASEEVTAVAAELAAATNAELGAATVTSSEPVGQAILAPLRARWPHVTTAVLRGTPTEALCDLAESGGYDLLVVGNKGAVGARRLRGSVADKIARRSPTNVLIVNAKA